MILAGEFKFYQLEKSDLKKFSFGWDSITVMPPRYALGAATNWVRKPHAGGEENLRGFTFFVEETYALCNEIT